MPKEVHIDEEDATILGRFVVPFVLLIVFTLIIEQYWQTMEASQQMALILILMLAATFVYRNQIREMIYS